MNRSQNPWTETPVQGLVRLNTGMDRSGTRSAEAPKTQMSRGQKIVGALALTGSLLIGGNWFLNRVADNFKVETTLPSPAQKQRVQVAIDKMNLPGSTSTSLETKAVAAQREKYHVQPGDTAWDIVYHHLVDENGQALSEQEARPYVDAIQAQSGEDKILDPTDIVELPENTHYTAIETNPPNQ